MKGSDGQFDHKQARNLASSSATLDATIQTAELFSSTAGRLQQCLSKRDTIDPSDVPPALRSVVSVGSGWMSA
jgi:hypothetical protein